MIKTYVSIYLVDVLSLLGKYSVLEGNTPAFGWKLKSGDMYKRDFFRISNGANSKLVKRKEQFVVIFEADQIILNLSARIFFKYCF